MGPKPTTRNRGRRTHSLGGCATCRRRHVKCDQVQPLCLTCKAVGVPCEGYASEVQWMPFTPTSEKSKAKRSDLNATRRHLYTEQSRASMSSELTAKLSANSVDASLTEIDSWSKNRSSKNDNLAVGPFGVLDFNTVSRDSTSDHVAVVEDAEPMSGSAGGSGFEPPEDLFPTPSTIDPLMSLDDSLQWADLFALDFGNEYLMQQDPFGPISQDVLPNINIEQPTNWNTDAQTTQHTHQGLTEVLQPGILLAPVSPLLTSGAPSADPMGDAHFLLKHFKDIVIDAMAGVPYTVKSPWKTLNLSSAVQTLASITYLGETTIKHANASNMYSLMACAAYHLCAMAPVTSSTEFDRWLPVAEWAFSKAKLHLEASMRNEFQGPGKAKYKDQLMAASGTMTASVLSGNQKDARRYLLESERVLRLRGLAKREISRKARTLHHVYTWARIVGESTYVIHDYNSYAPVVQNLGLQHQKRNVRAGESESSDGPGGWIVSHNARLDDFLRMESQHDSDLEIDEPKEAVVGLHDIHLEVSRDYPASLYMQIYGIPETWLSLVSQTTRLANVMDTLKVSNKETNVAFQNALQKRASRLENMICSFAFKSASANPSVDDSGEVRDASTVRPNHFMVQALNSALVIFFYRRVRDVNPWILQSHVDDVIKALQDYDKALSDHNISGPGTVWPAFMAGCEAIAPHRRETLLRWIQAGRKKSGMYAYKSAEEVLSEVWKRRDETSNGPSPRNIKSSASNSSSGSTSRNTQTQWTWVETSREKNIWLMLF